MRVMYFVTVVLFAVLSLAPLTKAGASTRCEICKFHRTSPDTGLRPSIPKEVCFIYPRQVGVSDVTFIGFDVYEGVNSPRNHILRKLQHKSNNRRKEFCLGVQKWVSRMVWVIVCDDFNNSYRGIPSITEGLRTGRVEMCLLGESCPRYVGTR
jgi:hypothetical protein